MEGLQTFRFSVLQLVLPHCFLNPSLPPPGLANLLPDTELKEGLPSLVHSFTAGLEVASFIMRAILENDLQQSSM